jgi:DNA-binding LacI/PurR family transcriptional regulator
LLRRIREGDSAPEDILVQPELVIRESTCAPRRARTPGTRKRK